MKSPLEQYPDFLVCTCMCVMYSEIVAAIAQGAKDFDSLKRELMVGEGCNSCVAEIEQILKKEIVNN